MLRTGLAGAGALMLPGAAMGQPRIIRPNTPPMRPATPQAPVQAPAGIDPQLFARAKAALEQHRGRLRHTDRIGIADYSLRSDQERFHILDVASGQVQHFRVAHGSGSDRNHNGYLDHFSNRHGSLASSQGAYATANQYTGKYGLSLKLHGLDHSNSNAFDRYIVMHSAWYAEDDMVRQHGKLGRSQGCFALSRRNHWQAMHLLGEGRMIYADKLA